MLQRFRRKKDKHSKSISDGPDRSASSVSRVDSASSAVPSLNTVNSALIPGHGSLPTREQRGSVDRYSDPLGLSVLHKPPDGSAAIDIIFVHGLGGTSRKTWSYNRDIKYFWPKEWLPTEPGLERARILSFGYNANFLSTAPANFLNITDFAKDLLMQMKFVTDETGQSLNIGEVPIMFVVHSMGGLVVKKAFILGLHDPTYRDIIDKFCSIIFLATPHRGSAFAESLNILLSYSPLKHSPKLYVAELQKNSHTLHEINEQFRHFVSKLSVVSFFETIQTTVGPKKLAIVEKDSSILGYPDEISAPLYADHHGICKYSSKEDPSYMSVRNVITSLVSRFQSKVIQKAESSTTCSIEVPEQISLSLGVTEAPESDFDLFNDLKMPDSCSWLNSEKYYRDWLANKSFPPSVLWINGPPGSGKSILATFVIAQLLKMDKCCQFYYFRYGERAKRSTEALLRSLIYQMASCQPQYCTKLLKLVQKGQNFSKAESRLLWQKAVIGILEKIDFTESIYWVIDALDESDSAPTFISLLSGLTHSIIPLHVLITGRVQPLEQDFERLAKNVPLFVVSSSSGSSEADLRRFVKQEMEFVHCEPAYKIHFTEVLLRKANGNFLWARLVLTAIQDRFDQESIEGALQELPSQLGDLYYRMESTLVGSYRDPTDQKFARATLSWVACAQRQLSIHELGQALQPEYPVANLSRRVSRLCGEFVTFDKHDNIAMVHDTAREFLTTTAGLTLSVDLAQSHLHLFCKCLGVLMDPGLRIRMETFSDMDFVRYAASSWSHHLGRSCAHEDQKFLTMLVEFLRGQSVLIWIYMLATWGKLRILVSAAKQLRLFAQRRSIIDQAESILSESFRAKDFLESWAVDLIKLVAKFGSHLSRHPHSIFTLVPAFCPAETCIYKEFGANSTVSIAGFSRSSWDDYLVKFSVGRDSQALGILCSDSHFATLTPSHITIWYADTCEEAGKIKHGERVLHMKFSVSGDMLVTCGFRTTKVWDLSTTQQLYSFQNQPDILAMDITFAENDTKILTFSDDGAIRSVLLTSDGEWQHVAASLGDGILDSRYGSPKLVAFHPEGSQIAIAYRGVPVLAWNLTPLKFLGKCKRPGEKDSTQFWADVNALDWNPITGHVIGAYNDGCLFKWHPMEPISDEVPTTAALVCCSPDGNLVATSSTNGTIRVWNFYTFALLYKLSCPSQSTAIALSPDSCRIYDIRESICNVWQPNALVRLTEADEKGTDSSSTSLGSVQASEATAQLLEPITALGAAQSCSNFFTGDDEGVLNIIDIQEGRSRELSNCWITLSHIFCSEDGSRLVTADLYGRVKVSSLDENAPFQDLLEAKTKSEQLVKQLLLSSDNKLLLVVLEDFSEVWSVDKKRIVASTPLGTGVLYFINHPSNDSYILAFGVSGIEVLRWQDLQPHASFKYATAVLPSEEETSAAQEGFRPPLNRILSSEESTPCVNRVLVTADSSFYLVELSQNQQIGRRTKHFILIKNADILDDPPSGHQDSLPFSSLPLHLLANIERILGLLPFDATASDRRSSAQNHKSLVTTSTKRDSDLIAFIDRDYWACTWPVTDTTGSQVKKHFFLPRDWINAECLELATVTRDGVFLCPKNGEVGIVRGGFKTTWID